MWAKSPDNSKTRTWLQALDYTNGLTLCGYSDWRLPDEMELMSIVNYGTYSPAIDTTFFSNTKASSYWTSITYAGGSVNGLCIGFDDGIVSDGSKSQARHVRCVRGQILAPSFTDNGNGTVTDNNTGLVWQQQDDDITRVWEPAISYCEGFSLAGYSDWRLPNIKELRSIVDSSTFNPAIKTAYFPYSNASDYWSSTSNAYYVSSGWRVKFYDGYVGSGVKSDNSNYVRCVRGGM